LKGLNKDESIVVDGLQKLHDGSEIIIDSPSR